MEEQDKESLMERFGPVVANSLIQLGESLTRWHAADPEDEADVLSKSSELSAVAVTHLPLVLHWFKTTQL